MVFLSCVVPSSSIRFGGKPCAPNDLILIVHQLQQVPVASFLRLGWEKIK